MAISIGTGSQILIQVVSVPIFLHFWNLEKYAIWLIALNLSQFTGILDLGMITANQNRFPKLALEGKLEEIDVQRNNTLIIFILNNLIFGFLYFTFGGFLGKPVPAFLFILFTLSSGIQTLFGMIESNLRIVGRVSLGINLSNVSRIIEFLSTLIAILIFKDQLNMVAFVILLTKSFFFVFCLVKLHTRLGSKRGRLLKLLYFKKSFREGYPFLLMKLSDTLALSGVVILVQRFLSPAELVMLLTSRTFFRLGLQISNLFNFTFYFELARTWSESDEGLFKVWKRRNLYVTLVCTFLTTIVFWTLGRDLYKIWTHDELFLTTKVLIAGALYSAVMMLSQGQKISFHASNNNKEVSHIQFVLTLLVLFSINNFAILQRAEGVFYLLSIAELISLISVVSFGTRWTERHFKID